METATIKELRWEIPFITSGGESTSERIWERQDGGARVRVIRQFILKYEILTVSVFGQQSERDRIGNEFQEALGGSFKVKRSAESDTFSWVYSAFSDRTMH